MIVFIIIISAIRLARFHLANAIIIKINLIVHVIYSQVALHCHGAGQLQGK